jgi:hypothetical protein
VGIVGSAGRNEDASKVSAELFQKVMDRVESQVSEWGLEWSNIVLVSGGSAFVDHAAVKLYLKHADEGCGLIMCFPAAWDATRRRFDPRPTGFSSASGLTLNELHAKFSNKTSSASLMEIQAAIDRGASYRIGKGFFDRNRVIGMLSERLLAFTFGSSERPKEGGTLYTWEKCCSKNRLHVPLGSL